MARPLAVVLLAVFGLSLAGCAGTPWAIVPLLFSFFSLVAVGCAESHSARRDGEVDDAPDAPAILHPPDAGGGHYERCCEGIGSDGYGTVSTCFCPAGYSCNYGLGLSVCADGISCTYGSSWPLGCERDDAGVDAGAGTDAGGEWEPCCELGADGVGVVTTCFCPASFECNYGLFERCGGDVCVSPGGHCPGGSPDV